MTDSWYTTAFGPHYAELYRHRDAKDARRVIEFVASMPELDPTAGRVLDLCCGPGRHGLGLLMRWPHADVTGLDLSLDLLREAQALCRGAEIKLSMAQGRPPGGDDEESNAVSVPLGSPRFPLRLVRGDMRRLPFADGSFRLALNLFTSFGYFERDADNESVLAEVARVLQRGKGRFVLDHINPAWLREHLKPETHRTTGGGARVRERRVVDQERRRIQKWIELEHNGQSSRFFESVRIYERGEITETAARFGLRVVAAYGGFDGSDLGEKSPRAVYVFSVA